LGGGNLGQESDRQDKRKQGKRERVQDE